METIPTSVTLYSLTGIVQCLQEDLRNFQHCSTYGKCHILKVGTRNKKYEYEMNSVKLESVNYLNDLGNTIMSNLNFFELCKYVSDKSNRMLNFIYRNFSFKSKNILIALYIRLIRSHLQYAMRYWLLHHVRDIAKFGDL